MRALSSYFGIVVLWILIKGIPITGASGNQCPISTNVYECKRTFQMLKEFLHDNDKITNISLLRASGLKNINSFEQCCFLLQLGTFYVTDIFPELDLNTNKMHREITHLANCMLGLKIELKHCHATMRCPCGEQVHTAIKEFKNNFYRMQTQDAAMKAVGEMNILFRWIEKNFKS